MTEAQARSLVAVVATLICAAIAALAWGERAVLVVFFAALVWSMWYLNVLAERIDEGWDTADQALSRVEAVENHLAATEAPSTGRHADSQPQQYRALRRTATEPPPAAAA